MIQSTSKGQHTSAWDAHYNPLFSFYTPCLFFNIDTRHRFIKKRATLTTLPWLALLSVWCMGCQLTQCYMTLLMFAALRTSCFEVRSSICWLGPCDMVKSSRTSTKWILLFCQMLLQKLHSSSKRSSKSNDKIFCLSVSRTPHRSGFCCAACISAERHDLCVPFKAGTNNCIICLMIWQWYA